MKIPKRIETLLERRAKAAEVFTHCDCEIMDWLEKHNLYSEVEEFDICGGCEAYVNPRASISRIKQVIEEN